MRRKNVVILGSTGSIGVNALDVIRRLNDRFNVVGLSAYNNVDVLLQQIAEFKPNFIAVTQNNRHRFEHCSLKKIYDVNYDLSEVVSRDDIDIVVIAMRGSAALEPFLSAAKCGKHIAPANKEALVIAGEILMTQARKNKATVIPIDSEQSAIFQCLHGQEKKELSKIILTASGGPLLYRDKKTFEDLRVEDILKHPRWKMGEKITVDSATLMNKGFELIEAMRLFNVSHEKIQVLIHPQAIIHSMIEFIDGSILAQLAVTDMRLPIQYALTFPERFETKLPTLDFIALKELTFEKVDFNKFPSLQLVMECAQKGGTAPAVLNAADEEAVEAFLQRKIQFTDIFKMVEKIVTKHKIITNPRLADIVEADHWARRQFAVIKI